MEKFNELLENTLRKLNMDDGLVSQARDEIKSMFKNEYDDSLYALKEHVKIWVEQNELLKKQNALLYNKIDDLEQYGRRTSLRIFNVPSREKETSEDVRNQVVNMIKDAKIDLNESEIDRAHRIGKVVEKDFNGTKTKVQPIIVKFTTFRGRTNVYKQRKLIPNVRTSLDLTKLRLDLLIKAREAVKNIEGTFAYSDINCNSIL